MTKLPVNQREIRSFGLGLALAFVWALPLKAAAAEGPPPPFVNADAAPAEGGGAPPPPMVDPGSAVRTQAEVPDVFKESGASESTVAAPQISDEQQIRNAMEMAYQLYHAEDYDACGKATAAILERYPKKQLYWVRYLHALCLEHQDLYARALEQYGKVRQEAARSTYANAAAFRVGLCELKSGNSQEAIYTLRDIIENNPRSEYRLQAYIHLGSLYRRTREWRAAQRIYKDLIKIYPNTSWAWTSTIYLAETHSYQGRNDLAIRVYEGLVRNQAVPKTMRAQAQLRIGDLQIVEQDWLEALHTYKVALRDFSDVPGVAVTAEQKLTVATEGRRYGRVAYRQVKRGVSVRDAPADEDYRLKQENEKVPYE